MAAIATLDKKTSSFFNHRDPKMVKWLGERKLDVESMSTEVAEQGDLKRNRRNGNQTKWFTSFRQRPGGLVYRRGTP